ncbi:MAG: ABC transporter substrate-binding protein [Oscillospiraceae bacterium]|nr:ABC transporter substrate-binding protein [Oscillospiraceae bacterium]
MNKRFISIISFAIIFSILTSCGTHGDSESEATDEDSSSKTFTTFWMAGGSNYVSYDEVQELYPDKTVLVWQVLFGTGIVPVEEVNEYLISLGKDYVVCFLPQSLQTSESDERYIDTIISKIENDEPVDIIYAGGMLSDDSWGISPYTSFVEAGLFENLDVYLSRTEAGQKLYDLMPENYWKSLTFDGSVYGIDNNLSCLSVYTYIEYNKELVEKYGFDTEKSIFEQKDLVEEIVNAENCIGLLTGLVTPWAYFPSDPYDFASVGYYDEATDSIISALENQEYISFLQSCFSFYQDGLAYTSIAQGNASYKSGVFANIIETHGEPMDSLASFGMSTYEVIRCKLDDIGYRKSQTATGVCAYSKHKDMAFDLLATSQTDEYLNNLLSFGTEDDYTMENGIVTVYESVSTMRFANWLICHPAYEEMTYGEHFILEADAISELMSAVPANSSLEFAFDDSAVKNEVKELRSIMIVDINDMIVSDSYETFSDFLSDLEKRLDDAGLETILDEANRQYAEWKETNP